MTSSCVYDHSAKTFLPWCSIVTPNRWFTKSSGNATAESDRWRMGCGGAGRASRASLEAIAGEDGAGGADGEQHEGGHEDDVVAGAANFLEQEHGPQAGDDGRA
jgi:hypothetical protein